MKTMNLVATGLATLTGAITAHAQKSSERPNIIMIMVDDMGFSDISPYGGTDVETPNLQRLADEGIRFRQFYNNSISAPTRASLITGQYQHKAGVGYFNTNLGLPSYQGFLNRESLTFAEVLRNAGYTTLMSGKWHVGDDRDQWPNQRGFDHFFGFIGGASNYYDIGDATGPNAVPLVLDNQPVRLTKEQYLSHEIANHALDFIDDASQKKNPFFLYLAFNAPHWPLQALPEDIAKYRGRYSIGWDSLRQQRYENAKRVGVVSKDAEITKRDKEVRLWNKLTYDEQEFWQRRQEVYAAMIDRVDQEIGRLLAKLKEVGRYDNTLIVFISDNGAQGGNSLRVYTSRTTGPVGSPGSYEVQNSNWSQTGNSPWRSYKDAPYEGGISAPFIAWYPKKINGGSIVDGIGHLIDIAPTFYDIASAKYPASYNGVSTNALPGKSLLPVLYGKANEVDRGGEPLFWERSGKQAVRLGKWKYVSLYPSNRDELYDIENDRAENHDVAAEHPEIVKDLKDRYKKWAKDNGVVDYHILRPVNNNQNQTRR